MKDRILQIMQHFDYSSSLFADKIDVSRPLISHILSERNKPGVELLQNILEHFPDISARWLMMGEGEMLTGQISTAAKETVSTPYTHNEEEDIDKEIVDGPEGSESYRRRNEKGPDFPLLTNVNKLEVKRITIYFADRSYQDFVPDAE